MSTLHPLVELLYPLQYRGDTPLHVAAMIGHAAFVECLLSIRAICVGIKNWVSWSIASLKS